MQAFIERMLENHEQEQRQLMYQIEYERVKMENDIEEMRSRCYPASVKFDKLPVQVSKGDYDGKLCEMVDNIKKRQEIAERNVYELQSHLDRIHRLYSCVLQLDSQLKCVLLALYYPKSTIEKAAEALNTTEAIIKRRKKYALRKVTELFFKKSEPKRTEMYRDVP